MRVLGESWCFCNGGGKTERMKAAVFSSKGPSMATIIATTDKSGTGFLIHRNLLLTTHINLPSVAAAEAAEIRLQTGVGATLFPHRFFITSSVLDLTVVGLDVMDGDSNMQGQHSHYLKTCSKPTLDLGNVVYLLGYAEKKELAVGEGKVVIATDNLIKLSTDGITWSPGSAGFDTQGNLAFMVCDPMKLATSPHTTISSSTSSSSSSKKDLPMQFGIPIPIICDWLNQHWEGNLDELNKPKLPLMRLMSSGQKSEHSCASFTMRRVFKPTELESDGIPSSNLFSKQRDHTGPTCSTAANIFEDHGNETPTSSNQHAQGIPTPEIYESPKLTSVPVRKKEITQIQLLDINFPPRISKTSPKPQPIRKLISYSDENAIGEQPLEQNIQPDEKFSKQIAAAGIVKSPECSSTGSVNGVQSEAQSSSPAPIKALEMNQEGYSSEGETTMYSAETAESRNYPSPRKEKFQQVGRSQSCVNYNRWGAVQRTPVARKAGLDKQRSFLQGRKIYSQGATSQRSNDFLSPTVSSIMKKRNNSEQQTTNRPRQSAAQSSPRTIRR